MLSVLPQAMDLTSVLNNRRSAITQEQQQQQQQQHQHQHHNHHEQPQYMGDFFNLHQNQVSFVKPETEMERSASPHASEHSAYSAHSMHRAYHSPGVMPAHMHMGGSMTNPMHMSGYPDMSQMGAVPNMGGIAPMDQVNDPSKDEDKKFACKECDSKFARRSDLSRHRTYTSPFQNAFRHATRANSGGRTNSLWRPTSHLFDL
jgi:hypothetical protein